MLASSIAVLSIYMVLTTAQSIPSAKQSTFAMNIRLGEMFVKPGATVTVDINLTNTSKKEIVIIRTTAPVFYAWKVVTKNGTPAPLTPMGKARAQGAFGFKGENGEIRMMVPGSVFSARMAPGKTLQDSIEISDYIDFSKPDDYQIQLQRTDQYTNVIVESNVVTLTVAK
jgi:hypothetical protein